MLNAIHTKRAVLIAQREQLIGQVNMTNGAIAVCEELIKEDQERVAREAAALQHRGDAPPATAAIGQINIGDAVTHSAGSADEAVVALASAPEMLPVTHDEPAVETTCRDCLVPEDCRAYGCNGVTSAMALPDPVDSVLA